ncbi:MAG: hypothetical protein WCO25_03780 [Candidatus Uhrbacteria bacterium]
MGPNLTAAFSLLRRSDLTEPEKNELLGCFAYVSDEDLDVLVGLLAGKLARARPMLENIRSKRAAFASNDQAAWKKILDKELKDLDAYQSGG